MRMSLNKKELSIILGVILSIIIAISVVIVVLTVRYAPKKLSGLVSTNEIVKIELIDTKYYNEQTQETEKKTFVLDESKYNVLISGIRNAKYKNRYGQCLCYCTYEYVIYYEGETEIHFNELHYYKKKNGKVVKSKDIYLNSENFYIFFL